MTRLVEHYACFQSVHVLIITLIYIALQVMYIIIRMGKNTKANAGHEKIGLINLQYAASEPRLIYRIKLSPGIGIRITKVKRWWERLIFIMEIPL